MVVTLAAPIALTDGTHDVTYRCKTCGSEFNHTYSHPQRIHAEARERWSPAPWSMRI